MKQNILMMISHDSGRMFSNYGYKVDTPHFDSLAKNSTQFDNFYCSAPQCSPSRGSILTGKYPHNNGLIGLAHLGFSINSENTTLPKELSKAGYESVLIGLSHETIHEPPEIKDLVFSSTTKLGYDKYISVEGDRAPKVADTVINFLKKRDSDNPFYLNVGFFETHREFDEYEPYADNFEEVEVFDFLKDDEGIREDISLFNGSLKVLDSSVGKIVDFIENSHYKDNTIIIFTTDHGVAFPGAKGTLKESGLGTALVISIPGSEQNNKKKKALLCNVDLMPTILELVDIPVPKNIDGESFAALLYTEKDTGREEFFTELTWHDNYHPMRGIRTKLYSYVRNFEDGPKVYMPLDAHLSPSGKSMRDQLYVPNESEELYDLTKDPQESTNLINDDEYKKIAIELRGKVKKWMKETNDPLLKGPVTGYKEPAWNKEAERGETYPGRREFFEKRKG